MTKNERIRELAEQAGFDVKRLLEPYPGGFPREDFLALESFAQMIVRECSRFVGDPTSVAVKKMKEHFGVE